MVCRTLDGIRLLTLFVYACRKFGQYIERKGDWIWPGWISSWSSVIFTLRMMFFWRFVIGIWSLFFMRKLPQKNDMWTFEPRMKWQFPLLPLPMLMQVSWPRMNLICWVWLWRSLVICRLPLRSKEVFAAVTAMEIESFWTESPIHWSALLVWLRGVCNLFDRKYELSGYIFLPRFFIGLCR